MSNEEKILRSLELLKDFGYKSDSIKAIKHLPAQEGSFRDYPDDVHPALRAALEAKGFARLYSHQRSTWEALREGKNVVVVTPTASGKTLCYNLPVLDAIMKDPSTRAMYLFPTKALSQDQQAELDDINGRLPEEIRVFTYDGDTPQDARKAIRAAVIILRKKRPDLERPYKTWGYPVTPIIFVLAAAYVAVGSLMSSFRNAMFGLLIICLGIPAYLYWKGKLDKASQPKA